MTSLPNLDPESLRHLEFSRNRLYQTCSNLQGLTNIIKQGGHQADPEALPKQVNILAQNLKDLDSVLTEHHALFSRIQVHPSTNFPGRTQEAVLQQLLRKKLEPELEDWVEEGRTVARAAGLDASQLANNSRRSKADLGDAMDEDDDDDDEEGYRPEALDEDEDDYEGMDPLTRLWRDAARTLQVRMAHYEENEQDSSYTSAEKAVGIRRVRTGLRRDLAESEDEEGDEDGEGQQAPAPPPPPPPAAPKTQPKLAPEFLLTLAARGDMNIPAKLKAEILKQHQQRIGVGQ